ncbi:hypothetical protein QQF64_030102 [Cirrhinus molitorella]|uniref:Uncharacterized protein n=1 Tax=Cirrhinus molitorella TaxID=172907 RepID=A0ABR3N2R2_9TELE
MIRRSNGDRMPFPSINAGGLVRLSCRGHRRACGKKTEGRMGRGLDQGGAWPTGIFITTAHSDLWRDRKIVQSPDETLKCARMQFKTSVYASFHLFSRVCPHSMPHVPGWRLCPDGRPLTTC